jgi:hypothetical protein
MITEFVEFYVGTHGCAPLQKPNFQVFLPVRAFISIEIIVIEIELVRRTLTKCRLKPYGLNCRAGNIFSIDIEALAVGCSNGYCVSFLFELSFLLQPIGFKKVSEK